MASLRVRTCASKDWFHGKSEEIFYLSTRLTLLLKYRIRPNYLTVRLGLSKLLEELVKYVSTNTKDTLKKDQRKTCLMMLMRFFSDFLYKSICCGTHLNSIDKSMRQVDAIQMSTDNICLYKEVARKYTCCNLKTTELLNCALIGECAVIRSNTVKKISRRHFEKFSLRNKL